MAGWPQDGNCSVAFLFVSFLTLHNEANVVAAMNAVPNLQ